MEVVPLFGIQINWRLSASFEKGTHSGYIDVIEGIVQAVAARGNVTSRKVDGRVVTIPRCVFTISGEAKHEATISTAGLL